MSNLSNRHLYILQWSLKAGLQEAGQLQEMSSEWNKRPTAAEIRGKQRAGSATSSSAHEVVARSEGGPGATRGAPPRRLL